MSIRIFGNSNARLSQLQPYTPNKKTGSDFAAQMEKLADTLSLADPVGDPTLKAAYDQLSTTSKTVLNRMKAGQTDITQDEWTDLCRELKDIGLISDSDFARTRADLRIVPIGYIDDNGGRVLYDSIPVLSSGLLGTEDRINGYSGLSKIWAVNDWSGDPLRYFDEWVESLSKWRAGLASRQNDDGTRKYGNLSHLESDISSCQKVTNLVRGLMRFL